jgi:hypothetical protein
LSLRKSQDMASPQAKVQDAISFIDEVSFFALPCV